MDDAAQRLNIGENEIRAWDGSVEGYLATVDPGDGQSKRFAADEIGELRCPECRISSFATPAFSIR